MNYVVTASVTALSGATDSLQCQLLDNQSANWLAMGEASLAGRASVNLQHAFRRSNSFVPYTVSVGCLSASQTYVVESAKLYAMQVGSIGGSGPVITGKSAPRLQWEGER